MRYYPLFIICFVTLVGCSKIDELTKFNMDYNQSVTIPASAGINLPFDLFTPDTETNSESEFEINDTRKNLIEEIKLTKLELIIKTPNEADFSFLKSIEVYISADGLDEIKIANYDDVPENVGNTLGLETSDVDIKEYIKKDKFNLHLNTITDEAISQDHKIDVKSTFFVDAKIFGI